MKKIIAILLSCLMLFTAFPASFAREADTTQKRIFFDDFTGKTIGADLAGWTTVRNGGGITHKYAQDPKNPANTVLCFNRTTAVDGSSYTEKGVNLRGLEKPDALMKDIKLGFKVLFPGESEQQITIRHRLNGSAQRELHFYPGFALAKGNKEFIYDYSMKIKEWNDIEILFSHDGYLSIWINGNIMTGEKEKMDKAPLGCVPSELGGLDHLLFQFGAGVGTAYVDDVYIVSYYQEELEAVSEAFSFDEISNGQRADYVTDDLDLVKEFTVGEKIYPIEWETSDENLIDTDGKVIRRSFSGDVTVTAKIFSDSDKDAYQRKAFTVTVAGFEGATDLLKLEDYAELYLKEELFIQENKNSITENIKPLPISDKGIAIDWESSHPEILDKDGVVTRPSYEIGDTEVTLTATLTLNDATFTKELVYTVIALPNPYLMLGEAMDALDYENISEEERTRITKDLTLPKEGINDTTITWTFKPENVIAENGAVTRGDTAQEVEVTATFDYYGTTDEKTYYFTVLPSEAKLLEADVAAIETAGWNALTESFDLPTAGKLYDTEFSWSSENEAIAINGSRAVVYRPLPIEEDVSFNLILNATNGDAAKTVNFPVKVIRNESDSDILAEALKELDFSNISAENQNAITKNLSLPTLLDDGVTVEWASDDETVITNKGEVIRPSAEDGSIEVELTAIVKKNLLEETVKIKVTVLPFENDSDFVESAKNSLLFSALSSEEIDKVTTDITLPSVWRGCDVVWTSKTDNVTVDGETGIVTRPEWGTSSATVNLTATLSYNGIEREKTFVVKILEKDYMEYTVEQFFEDFDSWTVGGANSTAGAVWNGYTATEITPYFAKEDPLDSENQVYVMDRTNNTTGTGYVKIDSKKKLTGIVYMGFDVFFTGVAGEYLTFEGRSYTNTQAYISISPSGVSISGGTITLPEGCMKQNDWNNIYIEADVAKKKFHIYLNGCLITSQGNVFNSDGSSMDTSEGIKYTNYDNTGAETQLHNFRFSIGKGQKVLLDNIFMKQKLVYTETQMEMAESWERQFVEKNDINAIQSDLILPDIWQEGYIISYESGDSSVIDESGRITLKSGEKDVLWTVEITDSATTYKKSYTLHVIKSDKITLNDGDAVVADVLWAVNYLKENYMLTALDKNMKFPTKGENGSDITITSSDKSAVSDAGMISRGNTDKSTVLTIKATKNGYEKTEKLTVIVAKKVISTSSTSSTSSGGGSKVKVTSGEQTVGDTGIDIEQPTVDTTSEFSDVPKDHWAYDEIKYLVDRGIMSGVGEGIIEPHRTIRREEFIKLLVSAMGIKAGESTTDFTDVESGSWYAPYIVAAKENGIINGYADGRAGIGEEISREDMAVMIFRAAELIGVSVESEFSDDAAISDYASEAVYALQDCGIVNGMGDGSFAPKAKATRAETASMIYKTIKKGLFD